MSRESTSSCGSLASPPASAAVAAVDPSALDLKPSVSSLISSALRLRSVLAAISRIFSEFVTPDFANCLLTNASAFSYITNKTNTGFTLNFVSVPVIGTSNITFDYIIFKQ